MSAAFGQTALLLMHVQNGIVSRFETPGALEPFQRALEGARRHDVYTIHVRVAFTDGYPELNPDNKLISAVKNVVGVTTASESQTQIHDTVRPQQGEPVVINRRISSFVGSNLDVILRSQHITHLVLAGISTSGVVLSTLLEASDKDFTLSVLSDACLDGDEEVDQVLLHKVFPTKAKVCTVAEWIATLA